MIVRAAASVSASVGAGDAFRTFFAFRGVDACVDSLAEPPVNPRVFVKGFFRKSCVAEVPFKQTLQSVRTAPELPTMPDPCTARRKPVHDRAIPADPSPTGTRMIGRPWPREAGGAGTELLTAARGGRRCDKKNAPSPVLGGVSRRLPSKEPLTGSMHIPRA